MGGLERSGPLFFWRKCSEGTLVSTQFPADSVCGHPPTGAGLPGAGLPTCDRMCPNRDLENAVIPALRAFCFAVRMELG